MIKGFGVRLLLCLALTASAGAALGGGEPRDAAAQDLALSVSLDQSRYPAATGGTPGSAHAVATLTNRSDVPVRLLLGGRTFVWQILDAAGAVVYDDTAGRPAPMFVMQRVLDSGKTMTFPRTVPLMRQDGSALSPGQYALRVTMNGLHATGQAAFAVGAAATSRRPTASPPVHGSG